jgi:hypothetical protein
VIEQKKKDAEKKKTIDGNDDESDEGDNYRNVQLDDKWDRRQCHKRTLQACSRAKRPRKW